MRKSLTSSTFRKRAGIAAAGVAAIAAITVPGVAWADDAATTQIAARDGHAVTKTISTDDLQKMIADGTAVPATQSNG